MVDFLKRVARRGNMNRCEDRNNVSGNLFAAPRSGRSLNSFGKAMNSIKTRTDSLRAAEISGATANGSKGCPRSPPLFGIGLVGE
jgi:hypothetical protein